MVLRNRSVVASIIAVIVIGATVALRVALTRVGPKPNVEWTARTAWGDPDLQGTWRDVSVIPFERSRQFGNRELLTDAELADREKNAKTYEARVLQGEEMAIEGGQDAFDEVWFYVPGRPISRRTSQLIDPPDGRIPRWTPQQLKRAQERERASRRRGLADSWEDRRLIERCINTAITLLEGPTATGIVAKRIVQTPGYVAMAIETQNGYDYRIVPLDGRPPLTSEVRLWMGDARGHWEGSTLVIDVRNLIDKLDGGSIVPASPAFGGIYAGSGENLHIIERYTRTGPDSLDFRFTIDDPQTYTRPYTAMRTLDRDDSYQLFSPSACHEANDGLAGQLASARADEKTSLKQAAAFAKQRQQRLEQIAAEMSSTTSSR